MIYIVREFLIRYSVASILALAILALLAYIFMKTLSARPSDSLRRFDTLMESLPFIVGLVPLMGLFQNLIGMHMAIGSIQTSGTGDPRMVSDGLSQVYMSLAILFGVFFLLFAASLAVRFVFDREQKIVRKY